MPIETVDVSLETLEDTLSASSENTSPHDDLRVMPCIRFSDDGRYIFFRVHDYEVTGGLPITQVSKDFYNCMAKLNTAWDITTLVSSDAKMFAAAEHVDGFGNVQNFDDATKRYRRRTSWYQTYMPDSSTAWGASISPVYPMSQLNAVLSSSGGSSKVFARPSIYNNGSWSIFPSDWDAVYNAEQRKQQCIDIRQHFPWGSNHLSGAGQFFIHPNVPDGTSQPQAFFPTLGSTGEDRLARLQYTGSNFIGWWFDATSTWQLENLAYIESYRHPFNDRAQRMPHFIHSGSQKRYLQPHIHPIVPNNVWNIFSDGDAGVSASDRLTVPYTPDEISYTGEYWDTEATISVPYGVGSPFYHPDTENGFAKKLYYIALGETSFGGATRDFLDHSTLSSRGQFTPAVVGQPPELTAAFGVQIFDAAGLLTYDSTAITWNQVDYFTAAASATTTRSYPQLAGLEVKVVLFFQNPDLLDARATAHTVTLSNGNTDVSIGGGNQAMYCLVLAR